MSRSITQYRVFIATPGGLGDERNAFRKTLEDYTASDAEPRGVMFQPVGWEETLSGPGRPQALINDDLKECDYAIFIWHDRWGSPTSVGDVKVGTEEEWNLAEELYKERKVRNIGVFFKNVDPHQMCDPGEQLKQVLAFKKRIEGEKRYLFKPYDRPEAFSEELRRHLARWLRDHEKSAGGAAMGGLAAASGPKITSVVPSPAAPEVPPSFRFWIEETKRLLEAGAAEPATDSDALFCARKALASGASDLERAEAKYFMGIGQIRLNKPADAVATFSEIAIELDSASDSDRRAWHARALGAKAVTLGQLGRRAEEISIFDDMIARFGSASELALREQVAQALFNKGVTLGELGRGEEEISIYDDVIARFGARANWPCANKSRGRSATKGSGSAGSAAVRTQSPSMTM
jgi:tetratricopeptide (TPR) repeat protein